MRTLPTTIETTLTSSVSKTYTAAVFVIMLHQPTVLLVTGLVIFTLCSPSTASYLDFPRINFAGQFRADTSTINNNRTNYNYTTRDIRFDPKGTANFYFFETFVTSVVYENGTFSLNDPIVNASLLNNLDSVPPKLVDLDTDAQMKSTIYGMNLAITWNTSSDVDGSPVRALQGDWVRNVIVHDAWKRLKCGNYGDRVISANGITRLENVVWNDLGDSLVLQQLKSASEQEDRKLSVRISHYNYTASDTQGRYTLGNVVGSIGVAKPGEPLNDGGERIMSFQNVPFANFSLSMHDSCYKDWQEGVPFYWAYKAPFQVKKHGEKYILSTDFANALSIDPNARLRSIGQLHFAVYSSSMCCAEIIGEKIKYLEEDWLKHTGGIVDLELQSDQFEKLQHSKLLLVRMDDNGQQNANYEVCEVLPSLKQSDYVQMLLEEIEIFVRPMDYYVFRLQKSFNETAQVELYVTQFGKPADNLTVHLTHVANAADPGPLEPIPKGGISPSSFEAQSNEFGIATFDFSIMGTIPFYRQSIDADNETLVADIDGQVYSFLYNTTVMDYCTSEIVTRGMDFALCSNALTFLVFTDPSEYGFTRPYTWVDHIQPIFQQYYRLYPVMSKILNMSNYTDVTLPHNIELLRLALSQDFMAPGYMPVTRDLSPFKQHVILEWLKNPLYINSTSGVVDVQVCQNQTENLGEFSIPSVELCESLQLYSMSPVYPDGYYDIIAQLDPEQPFARWQLDAMNGNCTIESLKKQVQQAVELEFATIPLYLTSLYSIRDGCNTEVYEIIRGVLMQEMLHMAQAANILLALGGIPVIDSNASAPAYPSVGLPGNVLPKLNVSLKRASREHIRSVFMGVEYPHETAVGMPPVITNSTIGQFYQQMKSCMVNLTDQGEDIFVMNASQLSWPWETNLYGTLYQVTNLSTAQDAINEIVEQGEGADPINPTDPQGQIGHFYRFEEIICGKYLVDVNDTYTFRGDPISFVQEGVWPMRDNPGKNGINKGTIGYVEARAFHDSYRALLRKLQEVFNGNLGQLKEAVTIMESLQVFAKKLMEIPLDPTNPDGETIGPVFDYIWDD